MKGQITLITPVGEKILTAPSSLRSVASIVALFILLALCVDLVALSLLKKALRLRLRHHYSMLLVGNVTAQLYLPFLDDAFLASACISYLLASTVRQASHKVVCKFNAETVFIINQIMLVSIHYVNDDSPFIASFVITRLLKA